MSTGILDGVRIVDLSTIVFGPFATQMLADMGAEVIKVEGPGGDQMRQFGKPKNRRGMGPVHMTLNRGKRAISLDLKSADDMALMREILSDSEVFVHNVRQGAIERLGLDYASVKALRPDIVYVHCVGFGSDGPYAGLQAYDDVIQAASGAASLLPRADGDPRPRYFPSLIADKVAGMYAAQAVLAALLHRERSGEGQLVEVPMFECFTQFMLQEHLYGLVHADPVQAAGYPRQIDRARQPFPTSDGYVSIVPYTPETIERVFHVLGAPEILQQERFADTPSRLRNMTAIYEEIARLTPARTSGEWSALMNEAGIPCMPVRDLQDIREDPHLQAVDFFHARNHEDEGDYVEMRLPIRFAANPPHEVAPPPGLNEADDVFRRCRA